MRCPHCIGGTVLLDSDGELQCHACGRHPHSRRRAPPLPKRRGGHQGIDVEKRSPIALYSPTSPYQARRRRR